MKREETRTEKEVHFSPRDKALTFNRGGIRTTRKDTNGNFSKDAHSQHIPTPPPTTISNYLHFFLTKNFTIRFNNITKSYSWLQ